MFKKIQPLTYIIRTEAHHIIPCNPLVITRNFYGFILWYRFNSATFFPGYIQKVITTVRILHII